MLTVELTDDRQTLKIGDIQISFMRTLKIPDDGRQHSLPPGLGQFPLRRVEDYADRVPAEWLEHGGIFLPMHEKEAMWMNFSSYRPHALKVALGMVNAVTGKPWSEGLSKTEQDYMILPDQPWLDGIKTEDDSIRQFIAMPLGKGYTVEGQVTGEEKYGGLQLLAYAPKEGKFPDPPMRKSLGFAGDFADDAFAGDVLFSAECSIMPHAAPPPSSAKSGGAKRRSRGASPAASRQQKMQPDMGLASGGRMRQKIYEDHYGVDAWDLDNRARVYVHICNAQQWQQITGEKAPALPKSVSGYHGPWFDVADKEKDSVGGSKILDSVKSVDEMDTLKGKTPKKEKVNQPNNVITYGAKDPNKVSDGKW